MQVKSQEGVVGDEDNLSEKLLIRVFFYSLFFLFNDIETDLAPLLNIRVFLPHRNMSPSLE